MSTRDGCASPCATSAWRVGRAGAATHALLASLALCAALAASPARLGAQGYYNLDAGRPTRVEDATPTPRDELDVQLPTFRYDQLASGPRLWRADSKLSYGVAAFTEIELRVPLLGVDPGVPGASSTIGVGGLGIGATRAITIETGALPAFAIAGEWVAPVGGLSARVGSFGAKLLGTKTFARARVNLNVGAGTWTIRSATFAATSCARVGAGTPPPPGCSDAPPPVPDVPCSRAPSNEARLACIPDAEGTRTLTAPRPTVAASSNVATVGPRYMAGLGVDHAFALSSTLVVADVVVERYVHLFDSSDLFAELGLRHQVTPQLVADVGVSRHFSGPVRSNSATLGLSYDLPLQHLLP